MVALATVQEFANYMQATVTNSAATVALNYATARIQGATGQMFHHVADDDVTLPGGNSVLELPQRPVLSVTSVATTHYGEITPVVQVAGSTWARSGGVLTWLGGSARLGGAPALPYLGDVWPASVRVVYTHGYATIPDDVKGTCLMIAAELYASPDGIHYESIDDYTWRRGDADSTPAALALKALKACYGMGVHSVRLGR